jgi:uncharacterized protein YjiS (DUF1127 family)
LGNPAIPNFTTMSLFQNFSGNPNAGAVRRWLAIERISEWRTLLPNIALLACWGERARMRRQLAELDDRQLRDIGVSPTDIAREILKPFWSE